jgi:hypothetical protein
MFDSKQNAREFAFDIAQELDATETDGWSISPTLDGAEVKLGDNMPRVRGYLDRQGYRVSDATTAAIEDEGWSGMLEVQP